MDKKLKFFAVFFLVVVSFLFVKSAYAVPVISGRVLNTDGTPYIFQGSTTSGEYTKRVSVDIYKTYNGVESLVGGGSASNETGEFSTSLYSLGDVSFPKTVYVRLDSTIYGVDSYAYFDYKSVVLNSSEDKVNVGDIQLKTPNVQGRLTEADGELVIGEAGIFFYNPEGALTRRAMAKTDANGNFSFYIEPGSNKIRFTASAVKIDNLKEVEFTVEGQSVGNLGVIKTDQSTIPEEEIYLPDFSRSPNIPLLLDQVNSTQVSKDTVGLNVHLALGGQGYEDEYETKLKEGSVKWVREHFLTKMRVDTSTSWRRRYNRVVNYYRSNNIQVVGLLAYGTDSANEFAQADLTEWENYIKAVVGMYKDYIKVWEIWNEPDSSTFMKNNTVEEYVPILKTAYTAIKSVDPDAIVLGGVTAWPYANFIEKLYQQAGNYFDNLAFHVYYCNLYFRYGDNRQLTAVLNSTKRVIDKYRPDEKVWVTEMGCSTGTTEMSISQEQQKQYMAETTSLLLNTGWIQNIFIYNFRDTQTNNAYEDNFGMVTADFKEKSLWVWFKSLPNDGAGQSSSSLVRSFFAYNSRLRGGYNITAGNVLGDSKEEIVTGTGEGMAPHVRVFDSQGNVKSQFFAFDSSLRNGVTVSACDVNKDGYKEIVASQGRGGWPIIKIFDGYGNIINSGFSVLDGKFKGGVNLTCGDTDFDGTNEILVAARQGGGPHVLVYNAQGKVLTNFMAYDKDFRGGINIAAIDMNGDDKEEIVTAPQYGAPHVQIFQIRANEVKKLSPGFYAFNPSYRGGVSVAGADIDGDGAKELLVGVGNNAQPMVKVYNIREYPLKQFYAYATNFLGGVNVSGGDVDGDGTDEVLTIPRGSGGPNVKIIEASAI